MEIQEHRIKKDKRVRLKSDGQDSLYPQACAGSEGWIRAQDKDPMGYPMVFIEWDKNHWAYNGEKDRWAFEAHFDPVEEDMADEKTSATPEDFMGFMQKMFESWQESNKSDSQPEEKVVKLLDDESATREEYITQLQSAADKASEADSFILIAVYKQLTDDSDEPILVPRAATCYQSPEGGLVAELQLANFAAWAMERLTVEEVQRLIKGRENES